MTRAVMYWDRMRLEVKGHAGGGEKGKDIVCAAISMLAEALVGVLDDASKRGRTIYECKDGDGLIVVWADPGLGNLNEIKSYFRMCVKGLKMLQQEYPNNVQIDEIGR